MPNILPFKAIRPTRDKVSLVASRAYDSYTQEERDARLRDNPFSFLHIVNPGYKYHKLVSGEERYQLVRNRYLEFKEEGVFMEEKEPSYYVYKLINRDGNIFHGIVAAASIVDYEKDTIKKHEDTLSDREELFKNYLKNVGFNAEAVLLTYPDHSGLRNIMADVMKQRPEYEFTTTFKDTHYLWPVSEKAICDKIATIFEHMPALYIADGHHRSASSYLLSKEIEAQGKSKNDKHQYFMSFLIPESELKIYEFNRLVRDLNHLSKEEFLIKLDAYFRIEKRGTEYYKPSQKHHFSMYLDGDFYSLFLRKDLYSGKNAVEELDTYILNELILKPILGIENPRTDSRLGYAHGRKDMAYVKSLVDCGFYEVGFGLLPITIKDMKLVADEGLTMPPKSTYIEPKLRSAVTIYEL